MSSPSSSRPSKSQRSLFGLELPSNLKWSTKSRSTSNSTRRRRLPRSTSSLKQPTLPDKSASLGQSTLRGSIPLSFKFSVSNSSTQAPSSFISYCATESGSASRASTSTCLNVAKGLNATNYSLGSERGIESFGKQKTVEYMQVDSDLKIMTENFEKLLLVSDMNEKNQEEMGRKEMKKDEKPTKTNVLTNEKQVQKAKEIPPHFICSCLDKTIKSSQNNQGNPIQEKTDQQFEATGKSKEDSIVEKKTNEQETEKKKKKKNGKKPIQEQQTEIKFPKFSRQLTPHEIAEDIFAMTGTSSSTRPKKRTKNIQRQVHLLTPGMWLESIDAKRYAVKQNHRKGK